MSDELTFPACEEDNDTAVPGVGVGRFRLYNVDCAAIIGIHESIFLHDLYDLYGYHKKQGDLFNKFGDDWVYYLEADCQYRTALSSEQQMTACIHLIKQGLIQKKLMGVPPKRYFRINFSTLKRLILVAEQHTQNKKKRGETNEIFQNSNTVVHGFLKPATTDIYHYTNDNRGTITDGIGMPNPPPTQNFAQCDNLFENGNTPTSQQKNIDLNPNLDSPKKKRHQKTKPDMLQFGSHVKLAMSDMKELVDTYGKQTIEAYILRVNRYCCASRPRGYHDYKAVILSWMDKDIGNAALAASRKPQPASNKDESREDRLAMGGKHINPALYALFVKQGRQMDEYVSDETLA